MKKNCLMCGAPVPEVKRGDSKFCSSTCKGRHWARKQKTKKNGNPNGLGEIKIEPKLEPKEDKEAPLIEDLPPPEKEPLQQEPIVQKEEDYPNGNGPGPFLNLIYEPGSEPEPEPEKECDKQQTDSDPEEQPVEEPLPQQYYTRKVLKESAERRHCREKLELCQASILKHQVLIEQLDSIIRSNQNKIVQPGNFMEVYKRHEKFQPIVTKAQHLKRMAQDIINRGRERENELENELAGYPPPEEVEEQAESIYYLFKKAQRDRENNSFTSGKDQEDKDDKYLTQSSDLSGTQEDSMKNTEKKKKKDDLETDLIVSGKNLSKKKKPRLNFTGKWETFLGKPQTNFFCVIHGKSGQGKSTFSLQFAKYLAQNFGTVLYISGEEGFANTFIEKVEFIGLNKISSFYSVEEIKHGEDILKCVPNQYHFVFIDSLNNMHIDPVLMQALRNKYSQSGFIAICQNTKAGQIRGSYEIVHDSDIEVRVDKGIAITNKNRFGKVDQEFDALAIYNKNKPPKDNDLDDDKDT